MTTPVFVRDLVVGYGGEPVVRDATFIADAGKITAIVGASGSGKTTLLRAIAGFLPVTAGTISFGDQLMNGAGVSVAPEKRHVGVVSQDGSLFPHLSVAKNISFGLPHRSRAERERAGERVQELLELVGLPNIADRQPHELSGGQQQRVALARALAPEPRVLLLDEPFSALDAGLRADIRAEVRRVVTAVGTTTIVVTHDQEEALSLADSVAMMMNGHIEQQGSPRDVYEQPVSMDVARFLGDVVEVPPHMLTGHDSAKPVMFRPEQLHLHLQPTVGATPATVHSVSYHGHDTMVQVELESGQQIKVRVPGSCAAKPGDLVSVSVAAPGYPL